MADLHFYLKKRLGYRVSVSLSVSLVYFIPGVGSKPGNTLSYSGCLLEGTRAKAALLLFVAWGWSYPVVSEGCVYLYFLRYDTLPHYGWHSLGISMATANKSYSGEQGDVVLLKKHTANKREFWFATVLFSVCVKMFSGALSHWKKWGRRISKEQKNSLMLVILWKTVQTNAAYWSILL